MRSIISSQLGRRVGSISILDKTSCDILNLQKVEYPRATHEIQDFYDIESKTHLHNLLKYYRSTSIVLHGYSGKLHTEKHGYKKIFPTSIWSHTHGLEMPITCDVEDNPEVYRTLRSLLPGTPIAVVGCLLPRAVDPYMMKMQKESSVVLQLREIHVLTQSAAFNNQRSKIQSIGVWAEDKRLRHALEQRAKVSRSCRDALDGNGFVEVNSPSKVPSRFAYDELTEEDHLDHDSVLSSTNPTSTRMLCAVVAKSYQFIIDQQSRTQVRITIPLTPKKRQVC